MQAIIPGEVLGNAEINCTYNIPRPSRWVSDSGSGTIGDRAALPRSDGMLRKSVGAVIGLIVAASLIAAQTRDKDREKDKKDAKEIKARVVKVDMMKKTITVTLEDGKKQDLKIDDDTKFVGPRGGMSDAKLKDDRLKPGAEIKFVMASSGKAVKEIHLPMRKGKDADKKDKDK
jgi:hypothetical protein